MNSYVKRKQWEIPGDIPMNNDQVCCTERLISANFFLISAPIFNNADWKKWYHTHATLFKQTLKYFISVW